jgi:hypothetical protein
MSTPNPSTAVYRTRAYASSPTDLLFKTLSHIFSNPEPTTPEPPEADCGHTIYPDEAAYQKHGKTYCPDCIRDEADDMPIELLAQALGYERID